MHDINGKERGPMETWKLAERRWSVLAFLGSNNAVTVRTSVVVGGGGRRWEGGDTTMSNSKYCAESAAFHSMAYYACRLHHCRYVTTTKALMGFYPDGPVSIQLYCDATRCKLFKVVAEWSQKTVDVFFRLRQCREGQCKLAAYFQNDNMDDRHRAVFAAPIHCGVIAEETNRDVHVGTLKELFSQGIVVIVEDPRGRRFACLRVSQKVAGILFGDQ